VRIVVRAPGAEGLSAVVERAVARCPVSDAVRRAIETAVEVAP
jgi:organic hydroperoxide reductase OsmC/OhrA